MTLIVHGTILSMDDDIKQHIFLRYKNGSPLPVNTDVKDKVRELGLNCVLIVPDALLNVLFHEGLLLHMLHCL